MKTSRQITSASLTLLMAGSSLLYTTPSSIVKAEPNQNVSNSLQTNTQRDRTSVKKQCGIHYNLDTQGYSAKISKDRKTWSYAAGVADLRTKNNESRLSLSYWQCYEDIHCNSATSMAGENRLNLDDSIENGCLASFKETDMMVTRLRFGSY